MLTGPIFCYEKAILQVLCALIEGRVASDISFGLSCLLLLCVRQLVMPWWCSEEQCYLLGQVSEWWLRYDLAQLPITSIMKLALPQQLPLNGKRSLTCLCLWFVVVVGIWSLMYFLFCWPYTSATCHHGTVVGCVHSFICGPICSPLIRLWEQAGGTFKTASSQDVDRASDLEVEN